MHDECPTGLLVILAMPNYEGPSWQPILGQQGTVLADLKKFDFAPEECIRWDPARYPGFSVGEVRTDDYLPYPAHPHAGNPVTQTRDAVPPPQPDQRFR